MGLEKILGLLIIDVINRIIVFILSYPVFTGRKA